MISRATELEVAGMTKDPQPNLKGHLEQVMRPVQAEKRGSRGIAHSSPRIRQGQPRGLSDYERVRGTADLRQRIPCARATDSKQARPWVVGVQCSRTWKGVLCLASVLVVSSRELVVRAIGTCRCGGTRAGGDGGGVAHPNNIKGHCVPIRPAQAVSVAGGRRAPRCGRCSDSNHFEHSLTNLCYNNNVVPMIPEFTDLPGAPWSVLPAGIHQASLSAVADRFASNARRRRLFGGLVRASRSLAHAGCKRVFLDGSFVTSKPWPGDYDACWDPSGVERDLMDPVFSIFDEGRAAQKAKFSGEFFPSTSRADAAGRNFFDFFQIEKFSGLRKGIVLIDLANDPMLQLQVAP